MKNLLNQNNSLLASYINIFNLKNQNKVFTLLFFLLSLSFCLQAQVEFSKNLKQSKDALIRENAPNNPIPNANKLNIDGFYWAPSYKNRKMALIRFDLNSALPTGAVVTSAKLKFMRVGGGTITRNIGVYRVKSDWNVNTVKWNNFNSSDYNSTPLNVQSVVYTSSKKAYRWDVTSSVKSMISGASNNYGWLIKDTQAAYGFGYNHIFASANHSNLNLRPVLEIKYTLPAELGVTVSDNEICSGESSKLTATGGSNYSWKVNGVEVSTNAVLDASPTETTTYQVSANVNGSLVTKSVTITVNSSPEISIISVEQSTSGLCDGKITSSVSDGPGFVGDVIWSGPGGYSSDQLAISNLCSGDYTLNVSSNGCSDQETVNVGECAPLDIVVEKKDICFGSSNGEISLIDAGNGGGNTNPSCPGKIYECSDGVVDNKQTGHHIVGSGDIITSETSFEGDLTVDNGVFIVCGSVRIRNLELKNGGRIIVKNGALQFLNDIVVPENCKIIQDGIGGSTMFYGTVEMAGSAFNLRGTMDFTQPTTFVGEGAVYNQSTTRVNQVWIGNNYNASACENSTDQPEGNALIDCDVTWVGISASGSPITGLPNSSTLTGLEAGTYSATINCNGCEYFETVTINESPSELELDVETQINATGSNNDGEISVIASGGTSPYTYEWTGPNGYSNSGEKITELYAGEYTVQTKDANGCVRTQTIDLKGCQSLDVTVNKKGSCFGLSNGEIAIVGGSNGGDSGDNTGDNGSGNTVSSSCPGKIYDVCYDYSYQSVGSQIGSITVNSGDVVVIRGAYDYEKVTINDGGVLIICGSGFIKDLVLTNKASIQIIGSMTIRDATTPTIIPNGSSIVCLRGTLTIYNDVELDGSIFTFSEGTTKLYGQTKIDSNGAFYNAGITSYNGIDIQNNFDPSSCSEDDDQDGGGYDLTSCNVSWNGPNGYSSTDASITGLSAGTYTALINCDGCEFTETVTIEESPSELILSIINQTTTPSGQCEATATVGATGGEGSYTYELTSPDGVVSSISENISNLCAGDYTVTVTDANGCSQTETLTISSENACPNGPVATIKSSKLTTCTPINDGQVSFEISGGTGDLSYEWEGASVITTYFDNLSKGQYTFKVTDGNDCSSSSVIEITDCEPNDLCLGVKLNIDATIANTDCIDKSNGSITVNSTSGGVSPYTYSWSNGSNSENQINVEADTYILTITDGNNCSDEVEVEVGADAGDCGTDCSNKPVVTLVSSKQTDCSNGLGACEGYANFSVSGGTSPVVNSWQSATTSNLNFNTLCEGEYTFKAIDNRSCFTKVVVNIADCNGNNPNLCTNKNLGLDIISSTNATEEGLANGSIEFGITSGGNLGGDAPFTFFVNGNIVDPSTTLPSFTQNNVIPGIAYDLKVIDKDGCQVEKKKSVSITGGGTVVVCDYEIELDPNIKNTSCLGKCDGSALIDANTYPDQNPSWNYYWDNELTSAPSNKDMCEDFYYFTAVNTNDHCYKKILIEIGDDNDDCPECDNVNLTTNNVDQGACSGAASASFTISGAVAPYKVELNGNDYLRTSNTIFDVTSLAPGDHEIRVTDKNNCTQVQVVTINDNGDAPFQIHVLNINDEGCGAATGSGSIEIAITGGKSPVTQIWDDASASTELAINNLETGTYTVTATDESGCEVTKTIHIGGGTNGINATINTSPANAINVCDGKASVNVLGNNEPYTYLWDNNETDVSTSGLCIGYHTVTVTDAGGCSKEFGFYIDVASECNYVLTSDVSPESCNGDDGSITLDLVTHGEMAGNCYTGPRETVSTCEACDEYLSGYVSHTSTDNKRYCVKAGDVVSGSISIGGGELVVCGSLNNVALTLIGDAKFINNGNSSLGNCVAISSSTNIIGISNYGKLSMQHVSVPTNILNYGLITTSLPSNQVGSHVLTNRGQINANANFVVSGTFKNEGIINGSTFSMGQGAEFFNGCTANFTGNVGLATDVTNEGKIISGGQLNLNAGLTLNMENGSLLEAQSLINSAATVKGGDDFPATFKIHGVKYGSGTYNGKLNVCNISSQNGTLGSDVNTIDCDDPIQSCGVSWQGDGVATGTTGLSLNNLSPGDYSATITCGNGCTETIQYTIDDYQPITVTSNNSGKMCATDVDGSLEITVTGGKPGYTYSWSGTGTGLNPTAQNQSGLSAGDYTVTVTDAAGCVGTPTTFTLENLPPITIQTFSNPTCRNKDFGSLKALATGGSGPGSYNYVWTNSSGEVVGRNAEVFNMEEDDFIINIEDQYGCTAIATETVEATRTNCIEDERNLVITSYGTPISCIGKQDGAGYVNVSGNTGDYTIEWGDLDNRALNPGTYTVLVTIKGDNYEFTESTTFEVGNTTNNDCYRECDLSVELNSSKDVSCTSEKDGELVLKINGATDPFISFYSIDGEDEKIEETLSGTDPSKTYTQLAKGKYMVEVIDGNCSAFGEAKIYSPKLLEIFGSARFMCEGENVELVSSISSGVTWTKDGDENFSKTTDRINVTSHGTYKVSHSAGTCIQEDEIIIEPKEDCTDKSLQCKPEELPVYAMNYTKRCKQRQYIAAFVDAKYKHEQYMDSVEASFRSQYITKCLESKEKFRVKYKDTEHHYTLYYYDQANNLVRTVPPKGVKLIDAHNYADDYEERLAQIKVDREKGEQTIFTDHDYITDYEYNSLNQLIGQKLPDHDAMDIFESNETDYKGGIEASHLTSLTVNNIEIDELGHGFLMAEDASGDGVIYQTEDGGKTWSERTTLGTKTLRDIDILDIDHAYVVGDNGLFSMSTDKGENWLAIPVGTTEDIVGVKFHSPKEGWLITKSGKTYIAVENPVDNDIVWTKDAEIGVYNLEVVDVSFDHTGQQAYVLAEKNGINYVYRTLDRGANWEEILHQKAKVSGFRRMTSASDGSIYLYGDIGTLAKSDNNGTTWEWLPTNINDNILAANFRSDDKGVIVTGTSIHKTLDDGASSEEIVDADDNSYVLKDISIKTDNKGLVITNNKVYATLNGGISYTDFTGTLTIIPGIGNLEAVAVSDVGNKAIVVDENGKFYNYNGIQWQESTSNLTAGNAQAGKVYYLGDKVHVIGADGKYSSRDGETSDFTTKNNIKIGESNDNIIDFANKNKDLYLIKENGDLFEKLESDNHWSKVSNDLMSYISSVVNFGITAQGVFIVTSTDGDIITSTDGITWTVASTNFQLSGATSIHLNGDKVAIAGNNGLLATNDLTGINTWEVSAAGNGLTEKPSITDVKVTSTQVKLATNNVGVVGKANTASTWEVVNSAIKNPDQSDATYKAINKSINEDYVVGLNAECLNTTTAVDLFDVEHFDDAISPLTLAVGANGSILKKKGINTWSCVTLVDAYVLYDTEMKGSTKIGYGVGKDGTVVKTEDAGEHWINQNASITETLNAVTFYNISEGIAVGVNGTIIRTRNGGEDHFQASVTTPGTSSTLNEVALAGNKDAYAVGDGGIIWKSTDKGANWIAVDTKDENGLDLVITEDLKAISFADDRIGYVAGAGGKVYHFERNYSGQEVWTDVSITGYTGTGTILDLYFVDHVKGYAVGEEGFIYKTLNGGETWLDQSTNIYGGSEDLTFIEPLGKNEFFIGGKGTTVSRTTDQKDLYSVKFWYDELGRIVAKQDARQFPDNKFSYTIYDEYNRIVESGEVINSIQHMDELSTFNVASQVQYADYINWLEGAITNPADINKRKKHEVSVTRYDNEVIDWSLSSYQGGTFNQTNLRPRVSSTFYIDQEFDGTVEPIINGTGSVLYDFASHYSYDQHGNVSTLLTENNHLDHLGQSFKRLDYTYDLISGNVNEVAYQAGERDEFYHTYEYDEDNRIVNAKTSHDHVVWENDAHYDYYRHSTLKRTELGDDKVQGIDYAYTIHGWLKGVNSETLSETRDLGKDGTFITSGVDGSGATTVEVNEALNNATARDEFGFGLKYYKGDYQSVGKLSTLQHFAADETNLYSELNSAYGTAEYTHKGLYNGNISGMVTAIGHFMEDRPDPEPQKPELYSIIHSPQTMLYQYDQLNRLTHAMAYNDDNVVSNNTWGTIAKKANNGSEASYEYDANGNIIKLKRYGAQGIMDDFEYNYQDLSNQYGGFTRNTNRLSSVDDLAGATSQYTTDLEDQDSHNYDYDGIGNLTKDIGEEIKKISWHVNGKVKKVERTANSTKEDLEFWYDAMGQRCVKLVKPRSGSGLKPESEWEYTYYVRDASGNTMAHYKRSYETVGGTYKEKLELSEQDIFGSSRLGQYKPLPSEGIMAENNFTANLNAENRFINQSAPNVINYIRPDVGVYRKGDKIYELSNHLGNVLAVVSDRIIPLDYNNDNINTVGFKANVVSANDYYPFGMTMPDRTYSSPDYRYGFNGMEKDDEHTQGNYDFGARIYDSRIGRWMSVDPKFTALPNQSPFCAMDNKPITYIDPDGEIAIAATVGFFKGLFAKRENFEKEGSSRIGNAFKVAGRDALFSLKIYGSMFAVDNSKKLLGKVWQITSRFIWELPQQALGIGIANVSVLIGVESVKRTNQGSVLVKRKANKNEKEWAKRTGGYYYMAATLGNIVNYEGEAGTEKGVNEINDVMTHHEFGHYQQSKRIGPLYLLAVALPSLVSASVDNIKDRNGTLHESMPWEKTADKLSDKYFDEIRPKNIDKKNEKQLKNTSSQSESKNEE